MDRVRVNETGQQTNASAGRAENAQWKKGTISFTPILFITGMYERLKVRPQSYIHTSDSKQYYIMSNKTRKGNKQTKILCVQIGC